MVPFLESFPFDDDFVACFCNGGVMTFAVYDVAVLLSMGVSGSIQLPEAKWYGDGAVNDSIISATRAYCSVSIIEKFNLRMSDFQTCWRVIEEASFALGHGAFRFEIRR